MLITVPTIKPLQENIQFRGKTEIRQWQTEECLEKSILVKSIKTSLKNYDFSEMQSIVETDYKNWKECTENACKLLKTRYNKSSNKLIQNVQMIQQKKKQSCIS